MNEFNISKKTKLGVSTLSLANSMTVAIFSVVLMIYITDYSGIYVGITGKAATVGTSLIFAGRLWDAINDPILAFVVDRSPRRKTRKFKPYIRFGEILSVTMCIALFNIPSSLGLTDDAKVIWLYVTYFLWAIGFTLAQPTPFISTLSNNNKEKTKLVTLNRMANVSSAVLVALVIPITEFFNNNMGTAILVILIPLIILSQIGLANLTEGNSTSNKEKINLSDIIKLFKINKPLRVIILSRLFSGLSFPLVIGSSLYYIKYAFGVENFALNSALWGMVQLIPSLIGTVIASKIIQKKNSVFAYQFLSTISAIFFLIAFTINLFVVPNIILFFAIMFFAIGAIGGVFVPTSVIYMECMSFNKIKLNKGLEASTNAVNAFLDKTQGALSVSIIGFFLILIGYDVDAFKTATTLPPELLKGLGNIFFLLPAITSLIGAFIMKFYPIDEKTRLQMQNDLKKMEEKENEKN